MSILSKNNREVFDSSQLDDDTPKMEQTDEGYEGHEEIGRNSMPSKQL